MTPGQTIHHHLRREGNQRGLAGFRTGAERIATFDNDGTLWCEQPLPVQLYFALDRVKALAPEHSEWKTKELFAPPLKGGLEGAMVAGDRRAWS